ncbi:hypothetical protein VYU27_000130 [Nannochloropsis oceanica]
MSSSPASPVVKAVHSHANTSWQDKSTRHAKKIVVIGAGAAGLHAAARLRARGFTDISIFEAGCAVGGRCVSRVMYDGSVPVEAGFLANIVSEARNPLAELVREYGLADQELEVGTKSPAISREEKHGESHEGAKDCKTQLDIEVTRFSNLADDMDDDDGLPRGFVAGTIITHPPPSCASSKCNSSRNHPPPLFQSSSVCNNSLSIPHTPSEGISTNTPKHISPAPSPSSHCPASSVPPSPHAAIASSEFQQSISSLTGHVRETSFSKMPPLHRFLTRGISNIKEHVSHLLGGEPLLVAVRRYIRLHKQLLGEYPLGMPPRPKNEYLAALDQKFAELLEHHDLLILIPVFVLCPVVFSQHFLLEIPALYGLWWYHPERVTALVDIRKGTLMPPRYTVLKCGWQALWARMVEIEGLDVHLNAKVKSIRRPCMSMKGKLVVEKKGGGRGGEGGGGKGGEAGGEGGERGQAGRNAVETYEFDFIVLAGSMKSIFPLLLDATNEEQELAEAATEFSLCSTIFEAEAVTGEQPVKLYPLSKGCAATGQVFAQINPRLFVHSSTAVAAASPRDEQQQEWDGDYDDKDVHGQSGSRSNSSSSSNCVASLPAAKEPRIVYQFLHRAPNPADFAVLTRRLKMHCDDQSFRELVMLKQCLWRFFPHFPNEDLLKKGWLWRLQEMQGQQGTLYLGASVCMDALNEVLLYNEVVLERILGD